MNIEEFDFDNNKLPEILPILKVKSAVLMPKAQLPVCILQSTYEEVANEVIENNIIGIVQPNIGLETFKIGCAGIINEIHKIEDEVTIIMQGLCRFEIIESLPTDRNGLERAIVSYIKYNVDINSNNDVILDTKPLFNALNKYFKHFSISPNWAEIEKTSPQLLISALVMACPLHPSERQSLLETVDIQDQSNMITRMIEINSFERFKSRSLN
ncbi:MAG: LON peptidase substrate-binding domain-containing protein [Alphaproteobacteria bacterium]|nr:LON peptidase substrate-binding domain-containing protein [Alphaproteobacteria bacterium]